MLSLEPRGRPKAQSASETIGLGRVAKGGVNTFIPTAMEYFGRSQSCDQNLAYLVLVESWRASLFIIFTVVSSPACVQSLMLLILDVVPCIVRLSVLLGMSWRVRSQAKLFGVSGNFSIFPKTKCSCDWRADGFVGC